MEQFLLSLATTIDSVLITPFTLAASPLAGVWIGSACLAAYSVVIGEAVSALLFLANRKYYLRLQDEMVKAHNLSVDALQSGDKDSYTAINKMAHEHFGKSFFANASLGMSSLLPVPFALWWLSLRFEGIPMLSIPWVHKTLGYPFVFLSCYIVLRILFARYKRYVPFFRRIAAIQEQAKAARGPMRSFFTKK